MSERPSDATAAATSRWHCEYAWVGGSDTVERDVLITATNGTITAIQLGIAPTPDVRRLRGVVLPGFANAHSHAFHRALRGREGGARGSFWTWREGMYDVAARLTPDSYRALATAVFGEMVCAGFTCVGEFHYLHHSADGQPYALPNEMSSALLDAAGAVGIKLTLLDVCYLESAPGRPPEGVQHRFADASASAWVDRVDRLQVPVHGVRLGAAVHSVRAVPKGEITVVAEWARRHAAPLHAHVSEQRRENEEAHAAYRSTPTEVLADEGAVQPGFTAVHATHLTAHDRELLGRGGAFVAVCPTTERDLGDGLVELSALREAGTPVCVGTDSQAVIDPFDELRCLQGHERLRTETRDSVTSAELLGVATRVGHASLGWDAGLLAVGAPCDFVAVSLHSRRLAGSDTDDLLAGLIAGAGAGDVTDVVVDGATVVSGREHRTLDVARELERSIAAVWR